MLVRSAALLEVETYKVHGVLDVIFNVGVEYTRC
jgi:hypothetical protein